MARGDSEEYPAEKELRNQLGPIIGSTKNLSVDRSFTDYNELSYAFENQSDIYYQPTAVSSSEKMGAFDSEYSVAFTDTDIPTSSTNYSRPRTVAAGYDSARQTMTVVFRDGTFYNYYQVTEGEWRAFKASISKGNPWLNRANKNQGSDGLFVGKPRGEADVSNISPEVREFLYRVVRSQQIVRGPRLNSGRNSRGTSGRRSGGLKSAAKRRGGNRKP